MEPIEPLEVTSLEETDFPVEEIGDALEPRRYSRKKTQKWNQQKWGFLWIFLGRYKTSKEVCFMQVTWRMIMQWGDLMCESFVV